ncbi:hypothetical protein HDU76_002243 [Blyttiomyces sp. JEL0837]|nr:hypothetical protein HDU76_002243 [Blyttiomyces sp. JEL0837]
MSSKASVRSHRPASESNNAGPSSSKAQTNRAGPSLLQRKNAEPNDDNVVLSIEEGILFYGDSIFPSSIDVETDFDPIMDWMFSVHQLLEDNGLTFDPFEVPIQRFTSFPMQFDKYSCAVVVMAVLDGWGRGHRFDSTNFQVNDIRESYRVYVMKEILQAIALTKGVVLTTIVQSYDFDSHDDFEPAAVRHRNTKPSRNAGRTRVQFTEKTESSAQAGDGAHENNPSAHAKAAEVASKTEALAQRVDSDAQVQGAGKRRREEHDDNSDTSSNKVAKIQQSSETLSATKRANPEPQQEKLIAEIRSSSDTMNGSKRAIKAPQQDVASQSKVLKGKQPDIQRSLQVSEHRDPYHHKMENSRQQQNELHTDATTIALGSDDDDFLKDVLKDGNEAFGAPAPDSSKTKKFPAKVSFQQWITPDSVDGSSQSSRDFMTFASGFQKSTSFTQQDCIALANCLMEIRKILGDDEVLETFRRSITFSASTTYQLQLNFIVVSWAALFYKAARNPSTKELFQRLAVLLPRILPQGWKITSCFLSFTTPSHIFTLSQEYLEEVRPNFIFTFGVMQKNDWLKVNNALKPFGLKEDPVECAGALRLHILVKWSSALQTHYSFVRSLHSHLLSLRSPNPARSFSIQVAEIKPPATGTPNVFHMHTDFLAAAPRKAQNLVHPNVATPCRNSSGVSQELDQYTVLLPQGFESMPEPYSGFAQALRDNSTAGDVAKNVGTLGGKIIQDEDGLELQVGLDSNVVSGFKQRLKDSIVGSDAENVFKKEVRKFDHGRNMGFKSPLIWETEAGVEESLPLDTGAMAAESYNINDVGDGAVFETEVGMEVDYTNDIVEGANREAGINKEDVVMTDVAEGGTLTSRPHKEVKATEDRREIVMKETASTSMKATARNSASKPRRQSPSSSAESAGTKQAKPLRKSPRKNAVIGSWSWGHDEQADKDHSFEILKRMESKLQELSETFTSNRNLIRRYLNEDEPDPIRRRAKLHKVAAMTDILDVQHSGITTAWDDAALAGSSVQPFSYTSKQTPDDAPRLIPYVEKNSADIAVPGRAVFTLNAAYEGFSGKQEARDVIVQWQNSLGHELILGQGTWKEENVSSGFTLKCKHWKTRSCPFKFTVTAPKPNEVTPHAHVNFVQVSHNHVNKNGKGTDGEDVESEAVASEVVEG